MDNTLQKNHPLDKMDRELIHVVTAVCLAFLTAVVYNWLVENTGASPAARFLALINASLFAALGMRFIPIWVASWKKTAVVGEEDIIVEAPEKAEKKSVYAKVFFSLLMIDILIVIFIYFLQILSGKGGPFKEALKLWEATDSGHYLAIARDWYLSAGHRDRLVQLVFLPGYPLLIRVVNIFVGNYLYSGMIASGLCFAGAGTMFYRLVRLDHSYEYAVRALTYLCILPGAFFFAAPMSESLFLLLSVSCIYFLRRKNWLIACLLAGWASFTRSLGLTLLAPILFEMIADDRKISADKTDKSKFKYFNIVFILLGFGAYLLVNYQVSGNPFQFLVYQKEHWSQSLGLFFNTVSYQTDYAIKTFQEQNYHSLLGLWLPNLFSIFFSLIVMLAAVKKIRPSYTAWFFAYYIIAIGATWLLSAPRYLLVLFPTTLALASLTDKRWLDRIITITCIIFYIIYAYMFVNRWQVW